MGARGSGLITYHKPFAPTPARRHRRRYDQSLAGGVLFLLSGLVLACATGGPPPEETITPETASLKERLVGPWEAPRTRLKLGHDGRYELDRIRPCELPPCPVWRERGGWSVTGDMLHLRPAPPAAEGRHRVGLDRSRGLLLLKPLSGGPALVLTRREPKAP